MPRPKRRLTEKQLAQRKSIIAKLRKIEPITAAARQLLTTDGFIEYYLQMRELYPSYLDAYEDLEKCYIDITGNRKYSDYDSLRRAIMRQ